jgi:FecR-like protein
VAAPVPRDPEDRRRAEEEKSYAEAERKLAEEHLAALHREEETAAKERERRARENDVELKRRAEEDLQRIDHEREAAEAKLREARERERKATDEVARIVERPAAMPAPRETPLTEVPAARIDRVEGDVAVAGKGKRLPAVAGMDLRAGDGLETVGPRSFVVLSFPDKTRVEVTGDTIVRGLADTDASRGKRLVVERGAVKAEVSRQPEGRPMIFATPHAEARVLGTTLRILADPDPKKGTRLEVEEGKVELKSSSGKTVLVDGGHQAVAATGAALASKPLPREEILLAYDLEDGKKPSMVETGQVERGPGNRICLAGIPDPTGGCRLLIGEGANGMFTFAGDEVMSFDYWVDPSASQVNFNLYNRTQKRTHDGEVPKLVLGKWTHVTVVVADLGNPGEHPKVGDLIVNLYAQGTGGPPNRRFYIDNLLITRTRVLKPKSSEAKR